MGEWNPYEIAEMDKEVLEIYLKHGYGFVKMYDTTYFRSLNDETAVLTLREYAERAVDEEGNLWFKEGELTKYDNNL